LALHAAEFCGRTPSPLQPVRNGADAPRSGHCYRCDP
jgi:hypothetical protein